MKLLSFGEIIWDVFPDATHIGGAPLNFAAHTLLQGGQASILSAIGEDEFGVRALKIISELGVGVECIGVVSGKLTGRCVVTLNEKGVPTYDLLDDTAYDHITENASSQGFDVLAFGTLALRHNHNRETLCRLLAANKYREIFSDLNIRAPYYSDESIALCLENATIVKISDEELDTVTRSVLGKTFSVEDAARAMCEKYKNIHTLIITLGAKGAYAYDAKSGRDYRVNATKSEVVSTVGAGDSFGATFLYWYLSGRDIPFCLSLASKISGFVVSCEGAVPKYDIGEFL